LCTGPYVGKIKEYTLEQWVIRNKSNFQEFLNDVFNADETHFIHYSLTKCQQLRILSWWKTKHRAHNCILYANVLIKEKPEPLITGKYASWASVLQGHQNHAMKLQKQ
jgi:hypothetical protein